MNIKKACTLFLVLLLGFPLQGFAGPGADSLSSCMAESMTGKERKQVAQWLFFAMAKHPDMAKFSFITRSDEDKINQFVGTLITRLLTENCPAQTKRAVTEEGSVGMSNAFESLGRVAMQELLADKEVTGYFSGYEKFLDKEKLNALIPKK